MKAQTVPKKTKFKALERVDFKNYFGKLLKSCCLVIGVGQL